VDEIPDSDAWEEQMYDAMDGYAYEWVQEWLDDKNISPYSNRYGHFWADKQNQRRRFMREIEAQCKTYQPVGAPTPRYDM